MLLIGLTGSIATGKSTVSSLLSQPPYSLPIIDADLLARKVVEPGTRSYEKIVAHFGPTTPDLLLPPSETDGAVQGRLGRPLNRPVLGRRVFGDSEERKRDRAVLNGIVHPAVRWEMFKSMLYYYFHGHWAVVLDIPLLFESGLDTVCGTVLVVAVTKPEVQMQRLKERDPHLSEEDAKNRVLSQSDVPVKATRADSRGHGRGVVIWNDGGKDELKREVDQVIKEIKASSPAWWNWICLLMPPVAIASAAWQVDTEKREKANV